MIHFTIPEPGPFIHKSPRPSKKVLTLTYRTKLSKRKFRQQRNFLLILSSYVHLQRYSAVCTYIYRAKSK